MSGGQVALALAWVALAASASVTCDFTADNYVYKLYIDGVDVTSSVTGNMNSWPDKKSITFEDSALFLALEAADAGCSDCCNAGGMAMKCTSSSPQWTHNTGSKDGWLVHANSGASPPADAAGNA